MKKVLITGEDSYIGSKLRALLNRYPGSYEADEISVRDDDWKDMDFSRYDSIFHVAGIVHKKETAEMEDLYYKVNRDLVLNLAEKAKDEGVDHFIFMSTMAVYGEDGTIGAETAISRETKPNPKSYYAKSKYEAEQGLMKLADSRFKVAIVRPPMVYGSNCPGNYAKLEKAAFFLPVFPFIENKRSMVHVDLLCANIKEYIDKTSNGIFLPQDKEYKNTSRLVREIASKRGKSILLSKSLGKIVLIFGKNTTIVNKVFGNLYYKKEFKTGDMNE